jgi:hypothetical protein
VNGSLKVKNNHKKAKVKKLKSKKLGLQLIKVVNFVSCGF